MHLILNGWCLLGFLKVSKLPPVMSFYHSLESLPDLLWFLDLVHFRAAAEIDMMCALTCRYDLPPLQFLSLIASCLQALCHVNPPCANNSVVQLNRLSWLLILPLCTVSANSIHLAFACPHSLLGRMDSWIGEMAVGQIGSTSGYGVDLGMKGHQNGAADCHEYL